MSTIEPAPEGLTFDEFIAWINPALEVGDKVRVSHEEGWTIERKNS